MLSNLNIMSSDTIKINKYLKDISLNVHKFAIDEDVVGQSHILLFVSGFFAIFMIWMLQTSILKCCRRHCFCSKKLNKAFE